MIRYIFIFFFAGLVPFQFGVAANKGVSGSVFLDKNRNGVFDSSEPRISCVCVSNGKEVVQTDAAGKWELPAENTNSVFVIKPGGYAVQVNQDNIPQYHYFPETVKSFEEIHFPLYQDDGNDKFSALFFGDTPSRGLREVNFIPHATMNDGAPNGYSIVTFDGNSYSVRFKAVRRPTDYQMNIYLPDELEQNELDTTNVLVNVFAGSGRTKVEMHVGKKRNGFLSSRWQPSTPSVCTCTGSVRFWTRRSTDKPSKMLGYKMDYPSVSTHMWHGRLPEKLRPGTYGVTVRTI